MLRLHQRQPLALLLHSHAKRTLAASIGAVEGVAVGAGKLGATGAAEALIDLGA
ncbi:MAG: hypothetical protein ACK559_28685 [bacterium]